MSGTGYIVCTVTFVVIMEGLRRAIMAAFAHSETTGQTLCFLIISGSLIIGAAIDYRAGRLRKPRWLRRERDWKSFD